MRWNATDTRKRTGFTLIELLAVITIIMLLLGLVVAAVFRVSASQQQRLTETQVGKLASAFEQQWKKVLDEAKREPMIDQSTNTNLEDQILLIAGNDNARARALWARLRVWQEFPQQFDDVFRFNGTTRFRATITVAGNGGSATIRCKESFYTALNTFNYSPDPDANTTRAGEPVHNYESAALLYLILNRSQGGMAANADDMMGAGGGVKERAYTGGNLRTFVDVYGTPIAFRRHGTLTRHADYMLEMSSEPYVRNGTLSNDIFDPEGKWQANYLAPAGDPRGGIFNAIYNPFGNGANYYGATNFAAANLSNGNRPNYFMPFIFSAGADKKFHTNPAQETTSRSGANDDIVSFRIRKAGNRGDQ